MEISTYTDALARFGYALSDGTRARTLLALRDAAAYSADLRSWWESPGRGCGLADPRVDQALTDLLSLVLVVYPTCAQPSPVDHIPASSGTA